MDLTLDTGECLAENIFQKGIRNYKDAVSRLNTVLRSTPVNLWLLLIGDDVVTSQIAFELAS